jgi:hypothetical protein
LLTKIGESLGFVTSMPAGASMATVVPWLKELTHGEEVPKLSFSPQQHE